MQHTYTKWTMVRDFVRGAKRYFIFGILCACLSSLCEMIRPKIIQYTIDGILGGDLSSLPAAIAALLERSGGILWLLQQLWLPAALLLLFSLLAAAARYFYQTSTIRGGETFVRSMRNGLFAHIEQLPSRWHSEHQTGDIIQRCTTDVEEVKTFLSDQLVMFISMLLTIVFALLFLFRVSVRLGLVAALSIPLVVSFSVWFHSRIGRSFRACDEAEGVLSTIAQENLTGVRVVRAFGREAVEQERFQKQNEVVTKKWMRLNQYFSSYFFVGDLMMGCVTLAILSVASVQCVRGSLTVGGMLSAILYFSRMSWPVRGLGRVLSEMSKTGVSVKRLYEIMSAEPEQDLPEASAPPMDKDICFEHVSFAYPGQPELLHDISFTLPAGTTLGILGGTGSGKSTLAQLLSRLYEVPEGGRITIGGVDLRQMQASWVRKNVGIVLQEPYLFSRSIAENIAISLPGLAREDIRRAASAACLDKTVENFSEGYDTFVGERGVTLSGGQKQRTAIARTLATSAPILIFDDSLSAVDAETDERIRENLKSYMGNATVILISHRITTLMAADQILVLEDGRITDRGTHAELSSRPGLYRTICRIQQGEEGEEQ